MTTMMMLARRWWVMAMRGLLAMLFGGAVLFWSDLSTVVLLFGCYAIVDGLWATTTAGPSVKQLADTWPVVLEGVVSVVLGLVALTWPFVSRDLIHLIVGWGIITGTLEIALALRVRSGGAAYWLLGTGGACSVSLALVVLMLPYADSDTVATALGVYAVLFGLTMATAAWSFHQRRAALRTRTAGW